VAQARCSGRTTLPRSVNSLAVSFCVGLWGDELGTRGRTGSPCSTLRSWHSGREQKGSACPPRGGPHFHAWASLCSGWHPSMTRDGWQERPCVGCGVCNRSVLWGWVPMPPMRAKHGRSSLRTVPGLSATRGTWFLRPVVIFLEYGTVERIPTPCGDFPWVWDSGAYSYALWWFFLSMGQWSVFLRPVVIFLECGTVERIPTPCGDFSWVWDSGAREGLVALREAAGHWLMACSACHLLFASA